MEENTVQDNVSISSLNVDSQNYMRDVLNWVDSLSGATIDKERLTENEIWFLALTLSINNINDYKNIFVNISNTVPKSTKHVLDTKIDKSYPISGIFSSRNNLSEISPIEIYHYFVSRNSNDIQRFYRYMPGIAIKDFHEFDGRLSAEMKEVTLNRIKKNKQAIKVVRDDSSLGIKEPKDSVSVNEAKPAKDPVLAVPETTDKGINYEEVFYNDISLSLAENLEYIGKIYTYLKNSKIKSKYNFFSNKYHLSLAILLSGNKYRNFVTKFYNDNGISHEKICEVCGVNPKNLEKLPEVDLKSFAEEMYKYITRQYDISIDDVISEYTKVNEDTLLNRLYSFISGKTVKGNFNKYIADYIKKQENIRKNEEQDKQQKQRAIEIKATIDSITDLNLYHIINYACVVIEEYKSNFNQTDDEIGLSALVVAAVKYLDDNELYLCDYLNTIGIKYDNLRRNYTDIYEHFNYDIYQKYLKKFIKSDMYETIEGVLKNEYTNLKVLFAGNLEKEGIDNLKERVDEYLKAKKEEEDLEKINDMVNRLQYGSPVFNMFTNATKVYQYLEEKGLIDDDHDRADASVCISYLLSDDIGVKFLDKYGINIQAAEEYFNVKDMKKGIEEKREDLHKLVLDSFEDDIDAFTETEDPNLGFVMYDTNKLLDTLMKDKKVNKQRLEKELDTGKEFITFDEMMAKLRTESIENLEDNINSVVNFGSSLSIYADKISNMFTELVSSDALDVLDEKITYNFLNKYDPKAKNKESRVIGLPNMTAYILKDKEDYEAFSSDVTTVKNDVLSQIDKLKDELKQFKNLKDFYELYIYKMDEYINRAERKLNEIESRLQSDSMNKESIVYLECNSMKEILELKLDTFKQIQITNRSEYLRILGILSNHYNILQSLITTRDVILPLICSESMLSLGTKRENVIAELQKAVEIIANAKINMSNEDIKVNSDALNKLQDGVGKVKENTIMRGFAN